ncbi:MAG: DNA repair exonuclease [Pirellulales bacterium]|nr:DNA repair exonuclease [Pirellulales bacterium]
MKILCTGDLHLGRRSSKVPEDQTRRQTPATVWEAMIAWAIDAHVGVVALTGDVVDRANRYFEALGPLERGLKRLVEAGIDVVAVSGNHDFDVLPRLVDTLASERFHLLGRGGVWQELQLERAGELLRVQGWSFPSEHFVESPLASYTALAETHASTNQAASTIVLLHGDLDVAASRYAPLTRRELAALPVAACLLGHVHRPLYEPSARGPAVLYPGSPQALDPGEAGQHGPWLLEVAGNRLRSARQIPLSLIRYEELDVDVTGALELAEVQTAIGVAVRGMLAEMACDGGALELLSLRLKLVGRTPLHHRLSRELAGQLADFRPSHDRVHAQVEKLFYETLPAVDLHELARAQDAPGMLARLILDLQSGTASTDIEHLTGAAQRRLLEAHHASAYEPIASDAPPDGVVARRVLHEAAAALLDELLAQKEPA